jgi:16S rRNA (cytidine1402-2'-O)-methyltransferase
MIFLESVHRIDAALEDFCEIFGADREAFIGRELTKLHEQCVFACLGELTTRLGEGQIPRKGEFVLVVRGAALVENADPVVPVRALLGELLKCLPGKQAVDIVARAGNQRRNDIYRLMLELQGKD